MAAHDRSSRWLRQPAAVAAVVVVSVLAACTGDVGVDDASSSLNLSGSGAFDPDREGPAVPIEGAVRGGTITVLAALDTDDAAFEFASMDPTNVWGFGPSLSIMRGLVTRSLTQYVYDPEQDALVLVPDIATDLGTPNEDFTSWEYTIRDGVRFEDGAEVTAEHVAYGIKRSLDRRTFPDGPGYSNEFFQDGGTYNGLYTSGSDYRGVVVNGDTLTIKMERPFPDMPFYGTFPAMGPIREGGSDPATYGQRPLATGPYKIAAYSPAEALTLVRNDEWNPDTDPGRHAYPERYEFRFTEDLKAIDALVLGDSNEGETTLSLSGVMREHLAKAQKLDRLVVGWGPCTFMWWPDYRKITDLRVRQALGYAYPYEDAADTLGLSLKLNAIPGTSVLRPGFPGRQDYDVLTAEPGTTNPAKAKALLREAGYAPGAYELKFATHSEATVPVNLLVNSLEAAGFKVTPFMVPTEDMYAVQTDPNAPINLRTGGWCPSWPSGGSWFPPLFHSKLGIADGPYFSEPEVDAEIERIQTMHFQEQPAAWGELDETIMTDYYPAIVTRYDTTTLLHGSRLGGVNVDDLTAMPTWKDLYIAQ
jgi:peptide/nickel transport system substrate-binding protein